MNETIAIHTPITQRQKQALEFIESFIAARQYPPTVRELCEHFNYRSTRTGADLIQALDRKGFIEVDPGIARGIRIVLNRKDAA